MRYIMISMISLSQYCAMLCYDLYGFYYLEMLKIYHDPYYISIWLWCAFLYL